MALPLNANESKFHIHHEPGELTRAPKQTVWYIRVIIVLYGVRHLLCMRRDRKIYEWGRDQISKLLLDSYGHTKYHSKIQFLEVIGRRTWNWDRPIVEVRWYWNQFPFQLNCIICVLEFINGTLIEVQSVLNATFFCDLKSFKEEHKLKLSLIKDFSLIERGLGWYWILVKWNNRSDHPSLIRHGLNQFKEHLDLKLDIKAWKKLDRTKKTLKKFKSHFTKAINDNRNDMGTLKANPTKF